LDALIYAVLHLPTYRLRCMQLPLHAAIVRDRSAEFAYSEVVLWDSTAPHIFAATVRLGIRLHGSAPPCAAPAAPALPAAHEQQSDVQTEHAPEQAAVPSPVCAHERESACSALGARLEHGLVSMELRDDAAVASAAAHYDLALWFDACVAPCGPDGAVAATHAQPQPSEGVLRRHYSAVHKVIKSRVRLSHPAGQTDGAPSHEVDRLAWPVSAEASWLVLELRNHDESVVHGIAKVRVGGSNEWASGLHRVERAQSVPIVDPLTGAHFALLRIALLAGDGALRSKRVLLCFAVPPCVGRLQLAHDPCPARISRTCVGHRIEFRFRFARCSDRICFVTLQCDGLVASFSAPRSFAF
jgi:hypothetical protein